jgi:Protein of unknown function (DUF3592)
MTYPDYEVEKARLFRGLAYALVILVGGGFLLSGLYEYYLSYRRYTYGTTTQGTVTNIYTSSSADHESTVYDVLFSTPDRNTYFVNNHYGTQDHLYSIGDKVQIVYESAHPEDARIDDGNEKTGIAGLPILTGSILLFALLLFHYRTFFFGHLSKSVDSLNQP